MRLGRPACWKVAAAPCRRPQAPRFRVHSNMANVNGVRLHFVSGGGRSDPDPAPQEDEYRSIMPRLAKRFTVMALDLRGIGQSNIASEAMRRYLARTYEYKGAARRHLCRRARWATKSLARPPVSSVTRGAMLLDAPLPASAAGTMSTTIECLAHPFHAGSGLPERPWRAARILGSTRPSVRHPARRTGGFRSTT